MKQVWCIKRKTTMFDCRVCWREAVTTGTKRQCEGMKVYARPTVRRLPRFA